jgi:hypothetical protein
MRSGEDLQGAKHPERGEVLLDRLLARSIHDEVEVVTPADDAVPVDLNSVLAGVGLGHELQEGRGHLGVAGGALFGGMLMLGYEKRHGRADEPPDLSRPTAARPYLPVGLLRPSHRRTVR